MNPRSPCRDWPQKHPSQRGQSLLHDLPSSSGAPHQAFPPPSLFWKGHRGLHLREPFTNRMLTTVGPLQSQHGNPPALVIRVCVVVGGDFHAVQRVNQEWAEISFQESSKQSVAGAGPTLVKTLVTSLRITHCVLLCDQAHYLLSRLSAIRLTIPSAPRTIHYPKSPSLPLKTPLYLTV